MRLPSEAEIQALYEQYHALPGIQSHMRVVAAIAVELGRHHQAHTNVNLGLVETAAKLHDLVRTPEQWVHLPAGISTPMPHAEINYLILRDAFPEVAETIRPHSLMTILNPQPFTSLEQKLVYYADKRVNHSDIVTLDDRLNLGWERWKVSHANDRSAELIPLLQALETELFIPIPYDPNTLNEVIDQTSRS